MKNGGKGALAACSTVVVGVRQGGARRYGEIAEAGDLGNIGGSRRCHEDVDCRGCAGGWGWRRRPMREGRNRGMGGSRDKSETSTCFVSTWQLFCQHMRPNKMTKPGRPPTCTANF